MSLLTKQKHRLRELGAKNGVKTVWDGHVHIALFKMGNQQGPAIQLKELCSIYVATWMGGEFGREWIHV